MAEAPLSGETIVWRMAGSSSRQRLALKETRFL